MPHSTFVGHPPPAKSMVPNRVEAILVGEGQRQFGFGELAIGIDLVLFGGCDFYYFGWQGMKLAYWRWNCEWQKATELEVVFHLVD
jgi:hypothetical protein